jgi:hypothetical protein
MVGGEEEGLYDYIQCVVRYRNWFDVENIFSESKRC